MGIFAQLYMHIHTCNYCTYIHTYTNLSRSNLYLRLYNTYVLPRVLLVKYYVFDNNDIKYVLSIKTTEEFSIVLALRQLKKDVATFNGHIFNDNL